MMVSKSRQKPKPEDAGDDYTPEYEDYQELETVNSMTPIWKKRSSDVEQKDYDEFYKSTFHDFDDPARTISFHAEGTLEYDALLFVPGRAPFDLYSKDYEKGLALYSSNVLIMEKCADLLPDYFNFVRGIVDSPDVTLNISRETLQQNRQLKAIAKRIEKKVTSELETMRDQDREAYEKFFENFGPRPQVRHLFELWHEGLRARRPPALLERSRAEGWLLSPNMRRPCLLVRRPSTMLPATLVSALRRCLS